MNETAQQRAAARTARVRAGIEEFDLRLDDLMRRGLGDLRPGVFDEAARRLVDAQARSLARRVRSLEALVGRRDEDGAQRLLEELGEIALLTHAWKRIDKQPNALPEPLRCDVRARIGWEIKREDVVEHGERVRDVWTTVGEATDRLEEHLRIRRTWLYGHNSRRDALLLRFAGGSEARFPAGPTPGASFDAEIAFYPSAFPLRAEIAAAEDGDGDEASVDFAPCSSVDAFLDFAASARAHLPWVERLPCRLGRVMPAPDVNGWAIVGPRGDALLCDPATPQEDLWTLLALSGGRPLDLFGEWNGRFLRPLAVIADAGWRGLTKRGST